MGKARLDTLSDRFAAKVGAPLANGCRPWTAGLKGGYGQINVEGRPVAAHRVAWYLEHGEWPADCLLHTCDNRRCVELTHLFEGTRADNAADMVAKGRHANSVKTHCPQGHPYTAENTKLDHGRRRCRTCLREQWTAYNRANGHKPRRQREEK